MNRFTLIRHDVVIVGGKRWMQTEEQEEAGADKWVVVDIAQTPVAKNKLPPENNHD